MVSGAGLGPEQQMKAWSPPKGNSSNDRFSRVEPGTKEACMEKVPNSDWDSLAGGGGGILRTAMSKLWGGGKGKKKE